MMTEFKIQQVRAAALADLREFIPKGYYKAARTNADMALDDVYLAECLIEKHYRDAALTPRQLAAAALLERAGRYCHEYKSADPAADAAEGVTPEIIKEKSLEHLQSALTEYAKHLPEREEAALMGATDAEKGTPEERRTRLQKRCDELRVVEKIRGWKKQAAAEEKITVTRLVGIFHPSRSVRPIFSDDEPASALSAFPAGQ